MGLHVMVRPGRWTCEGVQLGHPRGGGGLCTGQGQGGTSDPSLESGLLVPRKNYH